MRNIIKEKRNRNKEPREKSDPLGPPSERSWTIEPSTTLHIQGNGSNRNSSKKQDSWRTEDQNLYSINAPIDPVMTIQ